MSLTSYQAAPPRVLKMPKDESKSISKVTRGIKLRISRFAQNENMVGRKPNSGSHASHPGTILVGTASWSDPGFVQHWYPKGMRAHERLGWEAQQFEMVEGNST